MYKGIAAILIAFVVPIVIGYSRHSDKDKKNPDLLYYPKFYMILAAIGFLIFAICLAFGDFGYRYWPIFMFILLIVFFVPGLYWFFICLNYKVQFHNDLIEYKNIFGKKYKFEYHQITELRIYYISKTNMLERYVIVIDKKKIEINYMMINFSDSLTTLRRRLKKANHLHKIEITEKNKPLSK